jgi:hypothetical protein
MGASLIEVNGRGFSMREAYNTAVEDAIYEEGNDPYNGTISTTNGIVDITKEFKSSGKVLKEYADYLYQNGKLQKWGPALGICINEPILNNNKIKSQVVTRPQKGTRTWKTVYEVKVYSGEVIASSEFQIDAIKKGREYTERTKEATSVHISKQLVGSKTLVSEISYKKADKERSGFYHFIALAAE